MTPQDKRYDEYRRKCAEVDWYYDICKITHGSRKGSMAGKLSVGICLPVPKELPTYLDDASIDAVVRKLDDRQLFDYSNNLIEVMGDDFQYSQHIHKVTAEQKSEALYRTLIGGEK